MQPVGHKQEEPLTCDAVRTRWRSAEVRGLERSGGLSPKIASTNDVIAHDPADNW
jgi:hypothetical protein